MPDTDYHLGEDGEAICDTCGERIDFPTAGCAVCIASEMDGDTLRDMGDD